MMKKFWILSAALLAAVTLQAKVELPSFFSDNMVLQQKENVAVWGKATGKKVTITTTWSKQTTVVTPGADGKWFARIPTPEAGGPYEVTFNDGEKCTLRNVLIGEVWYCSGQSNMSMPMQGWESQPVEHAIDYILGAKPSVPIRICDVPQNKSAAPVDTVQSPWKIHCPESVAPASATAYFFAYKLHEILQVPIGILTVDWGGSAIEAWMSRELLEKEFPGEFDLSFLDTGDVRERKVSNSPCILYNGMASMLVHDILGDTPTYIYDTLDGTFPHHEPNPLIEDNCRDLEALVRQVKADVGVIYDGDADRVMFIDEHGCFISPDLIIGLMAHYFLEERGLKGNVLQDIRTSKAVGEYVSKFGGVINMWRVGRAYAAPKLREIDGIYGGELAGHYYFRDFFYSDSGIMASLIVLGIAAGLKRQGKTISEAIAGISRYANSGEINFKIEQKQQAMDAVRDHFTQTEQATASYDFDGYRVEFADWWFNIRPSNTEPYLRLLAEAKTEQMLSEKLDKIKAIIGQFK